jgi:hypothetical protein
MTNGTEHDTKTFKLIIDSPNESYSSAATFFLNNTHYYSAAESSGTGQKNYTISVVMPFVSLDTNIGWRWNYSVEGIDYNSTLTNITIFNVNITNCTAACSLRALNFTFWNGTTESNASMNAHVSSDYFGEFNLTWPLDDDSGICLYPNFTSTAVDIQLEFTIPGCGTRNYYTSTTLDNITENIDLYCDSTTSQVTFNVKNQDDEDVPDVYIYIQKYDIGTASATTTEIIKTDSSGQAVGNVVKNTQLYKFVLVLDGDIVLETSETLILLDTYTFRILEESDYFTYYDHIFNASCYVEYTNATTTFSYTWLDSSNNITQACLEIYLMSNTNHILVNNSCASAASGTISLVIPPPLGSNTYSATGFVYIGSDKFVCSNGESVSFNVGWKDYDKEGLFLSFLLLVFLITIGLWQPVIAITLMIIGVVLLNILGLFHLGWGWLIGFVLMGGIVIYKMRQT